MSLQIYYGGSGVLGYPTGQPIPIFSKTDNQVRYGERWNTTSIITLNGQITGCSYNAILAGQQKVLNIYNKDFQEFLVIQNGQTLYSQNYNVIRDISFDTSNYFGVLNYNVILESQPQNLFSGYYGVTSPVHEWEFVEDDNKLLNVVHKISAKGINTSNNLSNAFDNVKNYVLSLTGINSFIPPYFASYCTGASLCIDSFKENINRFDNTYSIEEKYVALDMFHGGAGYIRSTAEYDCDLFKGVATLSLNGEVKSCKNADLTTLRNKYLNFNVLSAAVQAYSGACGRTDLNPNYLSSGVGEDPYLKKITFNVVFDNDFNPKTFFDYSTDIKMGEDGITYVGVKGVIKSRGDINNRYNLVEDYYNNKLNLYYLANESYKNYCDNNIIYPLRNTQLNYSVSKNRFIGEISVSTEYDNRNLFDSNFLDLDYTLLFRPAIMQIRSIPLVNLGSSSSCNSGYYTVSLNYFNRAELSINGKCTAACSGNYSSTVSGIKNLVNSNLLSYYNNSRVFTDKNQLNQNNQGRGLDFNFDYSWSFDAASPATISPWSYINTLSLN